MYLPLESKKIIRLLDNDVLGFQNLMYSVIISLTLEETKHKLSILGYFYTFM